MIKASLVGAYSIGVDRKVLLSVDVETVHANIVRFLTDEELKTKYEDARSHGKQNCFIPPYVSQPLCKDAVKVLKERKTLIMSLLVKLQSGLPINPKDTFHNLDGNLFLNMDIESALVHWRSYWYSKKDKCLRPHKRGVTVTPEEAMNAMINIDEVHDKLEAIVQP